MYWLYLKFKIIDLFIILGFEGLEPIEPSISLVRHCSTNIFSE